ncbi:MAG: hypothetical protein CVU59_06880 [Deltaproteobacteria bacterium HGW-Deltaproteobacteria-17]|nr:MAG: hypothetical protein CVU59_06880 [Deltaproteobacteria bacterium HGW-Deltaproteobacteria-17]
MVPGAVCTGTLVAVALLGAIARHLDPFLTPFVWLAGLHVFLWMLLWCVRWSSNGAHAKGKKKRGSRVKGDDPVLLAASRMLTRSFLLSMLALLALATGGLFPLARNSVWIVVLAPIQWFGAMCLLALAFSSTAVTVALGMAAPPARGGFFPLISWALFSGTCMIRVWSVLLWGALLAWFLKAAFALVLWTQVNLAGVWQYGFLGPQAGATPPSELSGLVIAFNVSLMLTLFPVFGHLVLFIAGLRSTGSVLSAAGDPGYPPPPEDGGPHA